MLGLLIWLAYSLGLYFWQDLPIEAAIAETLPVMWVTSLLLCAGTFALSLSMYTEMDSVGYHQRERRRNVLAAFRWTALDATGYFILTWCIYALSTDPTFSLSHSTAQAFLDAALLFLCAGTIAIMHRKTINLVGFWLCRPSVAITQC